jgi:acetyl-CoA acyltransferase 1
MLYALMREVVGRSNLDPNIIEDVVLGNVRYSNLASFLWFSV